VVFGGTTCWIMSDAGTAAYVHAVRGAQCTKFGVNRSVDTGQASDGKNSLFGHSSVDEQASNKFVLPGLACSNGILQSRRRQCVFSRAFESLTLMCGTSVRDQGGFQSPLFYIG